MKQQEGLTHEPGMPTATSIKNIYACLVHEREDCIIDLVRNLHYHDPSSLIILYNGGKNEKLLPGDFPYGKFNVAIHPGPRPMQHGYLHNFALDCMQFAMDHFCFDTLTIVDSDQLAIRSGYSEYLLRTFPSLSGIGMLATVAERINPARNLIWPAIMAYKEIELWKPFLKNFDGGESCFVHWTFWPSTVFTSDAIRDLLQLFKNNKQLNDIMLHTRIWATEEVIFPTLVKLLSYKIVSNPCCSTWVKYRKRYSAGELNHALNAGNAYWMHPVERKYENPIRKQLRQKYSHYAGSDENTIIKTSADMLSTLTLLNDVKKISGWLSDREADLLISTTLKACIGASPPQAIVEIGSYHGKSTLIFASLVKHYFPEAKVFAIDPHEGIVGAADQGLQKLLPSLEMFRQNIQNAGLNDVVDLIQEYSYNVHWEMPIALLFIDGLHDYPNVARDFWHFSEWVRSDGFIAFHDYAYYYPGVVAFVDELLMSGAYTEIQRVDSLIILQKIIPGSG